jgi:hypothetical protein
MARVRRDAASDEEACRAIRGDRRTAAVASETDGATRRKWYAADLQEHNHGT